MSDRLWVRETFCRREPDTDSLIGSGNPYETPYETPGDLFRAARAEHGRCVSRVYVDDLEGRGHPIGWVFQKRRAYDDAPRQTYLAETWVEVLAGPDRVERTRFPVYLDGWTPPQARQDARSGPGAAGEAS